MEAFFTTIENHKDTAFALAVFIVICLSILKSNSDET